MEWYIKLLVGALALTALYVLFRWLTGGTSSTVTVVAPVAAVLPAAAATPAAAPVVATPVVAVSPKLVLPVSCPYGGVTYIDSNSGTQYCFYQGKDSGAGDIGFAAGGKAVAACQADSTCLGFNSNGFYKKSLNPYTKWSTWTKDPAQGFYTKASAIGKY